MLKIIKSLMFIIPLSFALVSHVSAANDNPENTVARGGGGGGRAGGFDAGRGVGGDFNRGAELNRGDLNRNNNLNNGGYYNGGGVYYNGAYAPTLLPDPVLTPNDDMDSLYNQNLRNMRKTGQ